MSAYQLAKDAARIASTATLSKDVIDLLQAKLSLLAEQIVLLDKKVALFERENSDLKAENKNLRAQLENLQPSGFEENMGVLWKETDTGFEPHPYCRECASHPIMTPVHQARLWVCANGEHQAPFSVKPPNARPRITGLPRQPEPLE